MEGTDDSVITQARTTVVQDLNNTDYSLILRQNTNSTTWKAQTGNGTGSKTMEIRQAQLIPTPRQFKVQYSTYATDHNYNNANISLRMV